MSDLTLKKEVDKLQPGNFELIKTNSYKISDLKEYDQNIYNTWVNKYFKKFDSGDLHWVEKEYKNIHSWAMNRKEYAPATKRRHVEALANMLLQIDKVKFKEFAKEQYQYGIMVQNDINENKKSGFMTESEIKNFVVLQTWHKLQKEYYQRFLDDVKEIKSGKLITPSRKQEITRTHMIMLILSLNTLIPPLRLTYLNAEFFHHGNAPIENKITINETKKPIRKSIITTRAGKKKKEEEESKEKEPKPKAKAEPTEPRLDDDMTKTNYFFLQDGIYHFLINHDKIESKRRKKGKKRDVFAMRNYESSKGRLVIQGEEMDKILKESYDIMPRKHVLVQQKYPTKPISASSYNNFVFSLFKDKRPTQNIFRKAYINYWYNEKNINPGTLETIARHMRHSFIVASTTYKKLEEDIYFSDDDGDFEDIKQEKPKKSKAINPKILEEEKDKTRFNLVEWGKEYRKLNIELIRKKQHENYEKNKDAILSSKILYNLNYTGNTKMPQKRTIEKYGLEYSDNKKMWISTKF